MMEVIRRRGVKNYLFTSSIEFISSKIFKEEDVENISSNNDKFAGWAAYL